MGAKREKSRTSNAPIPGGAPNLWPLIAAMSRPEIRIVSLTVTEGGYFINAATGQFDPGAPEIMADAAHAILVRPAREVNGRFFIDETVLREAGMADFSGYAVDPSRPLLPDFFLDDPELEEALRR